MYTDMVSEVFSSGLGGSVLAMWKRSYRATHKSGIEANYLGVPEQHISMRKKFCDEMSGSPGVVELREFDSGKHIMLTTNGLKILNKQTVQ